MLITGILVAAALLPPGAVLAGTYTLPYCDNFDGVHPQADWTLGTAGAGATSWAYGPPLTTQGAPNAYSAPNCIGTNAVAGQYAVLEDSAATSPPIQLASAPIQLTFRNWYQTECAYDGGRIELTTNAGTTWAVVTPSGGYPGFVNSLSTACLAGQMAYVCTSPSWPLAAADLSAYAGQTVQIRFHFCSDESFTEAGWYVDDVCVVQVPSPTATVTRTDTTTRTVTRTASPTATGSTTRTATRTYSTTPTGSHTRTATASASASGTGTATATDTASPTTAPAGTETSTETESGTATGTAPPPAGTSTPTGTGAATGTGTPSHTAAGSSTRTRSATETAFPSPTATVSGSSTRTRSETETSILSWTPTLSGTSTRSLTVTATASQIGLVPSATSTRTATASPAPALTSTPPPPFAAFRVYPNPARAGDAVRFSGVPPGAHIRVRNLRGEAVMRRPLLADASGTALWQTDVRLAAGVYPFRVSPSSGTRATGAVAVLP